jgi:hypothetical protein
MTQESKYAPGGHVNLERLDPPGESAVHEGNGGRDTQIITILDRHRADRRNGAAQEKALGQIPMLRPEDTGTHLALKEAGSGGAPVSFAVQLEWSPQPIDLNSTPRYLIFRSYTLYTTRARRDGREWFELRLGFFRDALSAKQVAYYLRSEFDSAAVVPVSPQEQAAARAAAGASRAVDNRSAADATLAAGEPPGAGAAVTSACAALPQQANVSSEPLNASAATAPVSGVLPR